MPPNIRVPPVRARDLRANVKEHGFETGVMVTLELMLEEHSQMRVLHREMAEAIGACADNIARMIQVSDGLKEKIEQMNRTSETD